MSRSCLKKSLEPSGWPARRIAGLLTSSLLVLALAGNILAGQDAGPWGNPLHRNTLDNGLTYIFQKDDSSEITCLVLLIRGGKSVEPAGKSGLAYLTTRLVVEIPDEGKVQDLMLQSTHLSVASLEDCTIIGVQCLSGNFEEMLKIVGEITQDPLFSGLRIDAIIENMSHQGKTELDSAADAGHAEFMKAFFGPEGYGDTGWGTEESLKSIKKNDIRSFYDTYFKASNMVLSVASDLEESAVAGLVKKYFGGIKIGTGAEIRPGIVGSPAERQIFKEKEALQSYLGLGFPLPGLSPKNYALAHLTEDIVGGGVGSRLWALRFKERLAYNVNSMISYPTGEGVLEAYLETSPEKLDAARASLEGVFQGLSGTELTEEDLEISKNNTWGTFLRSNEMKESRAKSAALFEARGLGCDFLEKLLGEIRNVSLDEMNIYLKTTFSPERAVEVVIGPKK